MTASANAAQLAYWNGPIGESWAREQEKRDRDHEHVTSAGLAWAAAQPGEHVLDVGCGSGTTTMQLARHVGLKGSVTGIDISRPMLAVARHRVKQSGSFATFIEADATD